MTSWILPNIAADIFDPNEICASCGAKLAAVDRVGQKVVTACINRNHKQRFCLCAEDLKAGRETLNCSVHWKCDCRSGYLCGSHCLRPELVQKRYKLKAKDWCDSTGFTVIHDQVAIWLRACKEQQDKALAHCGNCFSVLSATRNKAGERLCPKGCTCHCGTSKLCYVHLKCGCIDGYEICQFHKTKKPEIIVAIYKALPSTKLRLKLSSKLASANIDPARYPQRGRRPKEVDIRELVRLAGLATKPAMKALPVSTVKIKAAAPLVISQPAVQVQKPAISKTVVADKIRSKEFDLASVLSSKVSEYRSWLSKQGLSAHSVRNYLSRINAFIAIIKELELDYPPLSATTKDLVVRDLKTHLQKTAKLKPATLNSYLSAIDNFYGFLGLGKTSVVRADLPQEAPQALSHTEQKKFLRAVELARRTKDRAIATLLFYTGMRLSECAALELDDVFVIGRKTRAIIRSGKGGRYREIPLNSLVCEVIQAWLSERQQKYAGRSVSKAIFLNPQGAPMLANSIYEVVRKIGRDTGLELSPHTLRHTCLTALVRKQNDVVLVADIAGHKSLNTTKRYTLPTAADKAKALEQLLE